jgi:adenosylcobinamide kinase/adenosylcobinamide-phosphate guanylyltransferase
VGKKVFIIGGARSGKSAFAQTLVRQSGLPGTYVATAEALDDEMKRRIERHKKDRPQVWPTVEAPYAMPARLASIAVPGQAVLVDCLAVYVSNQMVVAMHTYHDTMSVSQLADLEAGVMADVRSALKACSRADLSIVVSNEVGLAIVPDTFLGRAYRDVLGRVNQVASLWADEVYFVLSGIPIKIKSAPARSEASAES